MASQTIESTTGKGAGEVPLSHVLVRTPAGAQRRCDESSTAPGAKGGVGQAMLEMDAGVVETTVPSPPTRFATPPNQPQRLLTPSPDHILLTHSFIRATARPPPASDLRFKLR